MKKRLLCILLSVCFLLTMVPAVTLPVFAGNTSVATLSNSTTGVTLTTGYTYNVSGNVTISNSNAGGSGIYVPSGGTCVIYLAPGSVLTVYGRAATGRTAGGAGINLPSNATLIITGAGTLNAYGGAAAGGGNGYGGYSASGSGTSMVHPGDSGAGGDGGGGAGAGIGSSGGYGGSGGYGVNDQSAGGHSQNGWPRSVGGSAGGNGVSSSSMGTLYVLGTVSVIGSGGAASYYNGAGGSGGSYSYHVHGGGWYRYGGAGGGGGGGGGGYNAYAIGSGGPGGGGGGAGSTGAVKADTSGPHTLCGTGGNGGGGYSGGGYAGAPGNNDNSGEWLRGYANSGGTFYGGTSNSRAARGDGDIGTCYAGYPGYGGNAGYYGGSGTIYKATSAYMPSRGGDFIASTHSAIQYTVTFDKQGGINGSNSVTANYGLTMPTVTPPVRSGYSFLGYYSGTSGSGVKYYNADGSSANYWTTAGNTPLYAHWTPKQYTMSYSNNGGTITAAGTAAYNITQALTMPVIYREGNKFSGWKVTSVGTAVDTNWSAGASYATGVNAGMYGSPTLTAQWALESYHLSFNSNGGNENFQKGYFAYNSLLPTPTKTGYTFLGWKLPSGSLITRVPDLNTPQTGADLDTETQLTAQWAVTQFTIYFNANGGAAVNDVSYNITSSNVTLPTPIRPGYTFQNWKVTMANGSWTANTTMPAGVKTLTSAHGTIILTAQWSAQSFDINLDTAGGSALPGVPYTKDDGSVILPTPTKTGYTFSSWKFTDVTGSTWTPNVTVGAGALNVSGKTGNVTLTAQWSLESYTISYNDNGGTAPQGRTTGYDTTSADITLLNPTRTGYAFKGWSGTGLVGDSNVTVTIPRGSAGNRSYTANWTANTYTVTLNGNGGTVAGTHSVAYDGFYGGKYTGTFASPLPPPVQAGFAFTGWYTEATGGNQIVDYSVFSPEEPVNGGVTLYAHWTLKALVPVATQTQTYVYDGQPKAFVLHNTGGLGGFTVAYSQGGSPVIGPTNAGTYDVTITRAEDATHGAFHDTSTLTIKKAEIEYSVADYSGNINDEDIGIQVNVTKPSEGVTVEFSPDGNNWSETQPTNGIDGAYESGTYDVRYKITAENYETVEGQARVTLDEAEDKTLMTGCSFAPYIGEYDGEAHEITVSGVPAEAVVLYSTDQNNWDGEPITLTNVGTTVVYVKISADGYYDYTGAAAIVVTPKPITVPTVGASLTYNGSDQTPSLTGTGGYTVSVTSQKNAGNYAATVTLVDPFNTIWAGGGTGSLTLNWAIAKKEVYVKGSSQTITYGGVPAAAGASYSFEDSGGQTVSLQQDVDYSGTVDVQYDYLCDYLRYDPVGSYQIHVLTSGLTSANYSFTARNGSLTVNPRAVSLTWSGDDGAVYDRTQKTVTATVSNPVNGDSVTVSGYTNHQKTDAGSYTATATGLSSGNYTLTGGANISESWAIEKAPATGLQITPLETPVYGGAYTLSVASGTGGDGAVTYAASPAGGATITGNQITVKTIDAVTVTATQAAGANYLGTSATYTFTPGKAPVTITGVAAQTRMYDGSTAVTLTDAGALSGRASWDTDEELVLVTTNARGATNDAEAGAGKPVNLSGYDLAGTKSSCYYLVLPTSVTVEITALEISWPVAPPALVYNGMAQTPDITASPYYDVTVAPQTDAGTHTATVNLKPGYKWSNGSTNAYTVNWTIGKAVLTITANEKQITYGEGPSDNSYSAMGFLGSDSSDVISGTESYSYNYTQYGNVGDYTITPIVTGLSADNYSFVPENGLLRVVPREAILTWVTPTVGTVYNGAPKTVSVSIDNKISGDDVSALFTMEGADGDAVTNAGTYTAQVTGFEGTKAANYALPNNITATFTIEKAPITVTAANREITYGDSPQLEITTGLWIAIFKDGKYEVAAERNPQGELVLLDGLDRTKVVGIKKLPGETVCPETGVDLSRIVPDVVANPVITTAVKGDVDGDGEEDDFIDLWIAVLKDGKYEVATETNLRGELVLREDLDRGAVVVGIKKLPEETVCPESGVDSSRIVSNVVAPGFITSEVKEAYTTTQLVQSNYIQVTGGAGVENLEVTLAYNYIAGNDVGDYTITPTISGSAGENYTLNPVNGVLTVRPKPLDVPTLTKKIFDYSGAPINVTDSDNLKGYNEIGMRLFGYEYTTSSNYKLFIQLASENFVWSPGSTGINSQGVVELPWSIAMIGQTPLSIAASPDDTEHIYPYGTTVTLTAQGGSGTGGYTWTLVNGPAVIRPTGGVCEVDVKGLGPISISLLKAHDEGYSEQLAYITLTGIKRTVQPVITPVDRIYDGTRTIALTSNLGSLLGCGEAVTLNSAGVLSQVATKDIGSGKPVTITGSFSLSAVNPTVLQFYELVQPEKTGKTVNITPKEVTVSALRTITYGETYHNDATITFTGFVAGEGEWLVQNRGKLGYLPANYTGGAGSYPITLTYEEGAAATGSALNGLTAPNYTFVSGGGALTVKQRPVTLGWQGTLFSYEAGVTRTVTATVTNPVPGDTVTVTAYTNNEKEAEGLYLAAATALSNTNYTLTGGSGITHNWGIGAVTVPSDTPAPAGGMGGGVVPGDTGVVVVIDGTTYDFATQETEGGVTTVTADQKKLQEQLEKAQESVVFPVDAQAESVEVDLLVSNIEEMAKRELTLTVDVGGVQYIIDTAAVDTVALMKELGETDPQKVSFQVIIHQMSPSEVTVQEGRLMLPPVEFEVLAEIGGKQVVLREYADYIQRIIPIPAGVNPQEITTAVVLEEDGSSRHVPTAVFQGADGRWYARISSRTNSVYALIYRSVSFWDAKGTWYENTAQEMGSRLILKGREDASFDGEASITRAEFAAILVRALGLPEKGYEADFADVPEGAWYHGAVAAAAKYGLIQGRGEGLFDPLAPITRQEAMEMMAKAAKIAGFEGTVGNLAPFADGGQVADWAIPAATWNVGSGLIVGSEGRLHPQNSISRAESATVILRLLQKAQLVDIRSNTLAQ